MPGSKALPEHVLHGARREKAGLRNFSGQISGRGAVTASAESGAYVRGQGFGMAQQTKDGQFSSFLSYVCIDRI